jgi:hypothetical protein
MKMTEIDNERRQAHGYLKGKLRTMIIHLTLYPKLRYAPPTCLKCEDEAGDKGFLSKTGETTLTCLRCGATYELKEK